MKKLFVPLIFMVIGSNSWADGESTQDVSSIYPSKAEVIWVVCQSGEQVNFKETVSPGQTIELGPSQIGMFGTARGNRLMKVEMNNEGFHYASGKPPCPLGDTLVIQFNVK